MKLFLGPTIMIFGFVLSQGTAGSGQTPTVPVGEEFQINTFTTDIQTVPAIAMSESGDFVVVWRSFGLEDGDTSPTSIQGQRFGSAGGMIGSQFLVNTYTTDYQRSPDVAMDAAGNFIAVWVSNGSANGDSAGLSIQGRRFLSTGAPFSTDFLVNTYTTGSQQAPSVAANGEGDFIVVWESDGSANGDTSSLSIQGQRYESSGSPIGEQFQINTYTTNPQWSPSVVLSESGDFVVVWRSNGSLSPTASLSIEGQRFASTGDPIGGQFLINTYTGDSQGQPMVALNKNDDFVVVWRSIGLENSDTTYSIQGQRYASSGDPLASQLKISSFGGGITSYPSVGIDDSGSFVVVWDTGQTAYDTSYSIQAQRYTSTGNRLGSQLQMNAYTTGLQIIPDLAMDSSGDFVVVWDSNGSNDSDTSSRSIQGRRFRVTADLGDRVFLDADLDGIQDPSEPGIPGIPVHLFEETGDLVASTETNAQGAFLFRPKIGLSGAVDEFYLELEAPFRYSFTDTDVGPDDTVDSDVDTVFGQTETIEVLSAGDSHLHVDAGMTNGIGNRVWDDLNGNGIQDGGEPGLEGVTVELFDIEDTLVHTVDTVAGGWYAFSDLDAGTYYVKFTAPGGLAFVSRDRGADDRFDSDVDPFLGTTPPFPFPIGTIDKDWDVGLEPAVIGNRIWLDANADGRQQPYEVGISGVTVKLENAAGVELASTTSGADGLYGFTNIPSGSYRIEVSPPDDGLFSPQDVGNDDLIDSDVDPANGRSELFVYVTGTGSRSHDAGLLFLPLFADGFESGNTSMWTSTEP